MTVPNPFTDVVATMPEEFSARLLGGIGDAFLATLPSSYPNVFQSTGFLAQIEKHIVDCEATLILVGVTDRLGDPVAAFAFVRRKRRGIWMLEAMDFGITDYFAPAYFREAALSAADTRKLWNAVSKVVPDVHAIAFKKLPRLLHHRPHALSGADFLKPMGACATTLHLLDAAGMPTATLDQASLRRKIGKTAKILQKLGALAFSEATTKAEADSYMETLVAFRTARFGELGRYDAMLDPHIVAFYRALADRNAQDPIGRVFALRSGDDIIAVAYGFSFGGVFTLIAPAISPRKDVQHGSPGLVIMFKVVEWCREQGYEIFDLSVGSMSYKSRFEAETVELFEYQQARTPLGFVIVAEAGLRRWIRRRAVQQPRLKALLEKVRSFRVRSSRERNTHA